MAHDPRFNVSENTRRLKVYIDEVEGGEYFRAREVSRLIKAGADIGSLNQAQRQILLSALAGSDYGNTVEILLQSGHYDEEDLDDAVHSAARTFADHSDETLSTLLGNGGRPNREDLKAALRQEARGRGVGRGSENIGINKIKHILEHNPYLVNSLDRDGFADDSTPLMYALKTHDGNRCSIHAIRLLLNHGADPNLQDANGKTPLMYAATRDQQIIRLLIEKGAEPLLQNKQGSFAKNYARSNPIKELLKVNNGKNKNKNKNNNNEKNSSTRRRGGDRSRTKKNRK
jgi:ankyrin repeat protein